MTWSNFRKIPSKIEWDLTNGPLSKLLELLDTGLGVRSVGPVGDFLDLKVGWQKIPDKNCWRFFLIDKNHARILNNGVTLSHFFEN